MKTVITAASVFAFGAVTLTVGQTPAASADFYKSKRMTMYIGYSAGGGYDRYARSTARHMHRHIPGNPKIISKNLTGAGGLRMTNALYGRFKQDGTIVGIIPSRSALEAIQGNPGAKFNATKFQWLGSANKETAICTFWHTAPIKTVDDLLTKSAIVGGIGPGTGSDTNTMMLNNLMGTKLRLITGYPGSADLSLAMERGEVDGRCGHTWSSVRATQKKWLDAKKIVIPLQLALKANPELKGVPLVTKYIKNDLDLKALKMIVAPLTMGRPFAVGPKVPKDRVKILRAAFMATMKDKEFLKEAKKGRVPINPVSGAEVQTLVANLYAQPPEVIKRMSEAISKTNNTRITKAVVKTYTHRGKITALKRGGKRVSWKGKEAKGKLRVGGKTKITVGGKTAKRKALKVGMSCTFKVKGAQKALGIDCS